MKKSVVEHLFLNQWLDQIKEEYLETQKHFSHIKIVSCINSNEVIRIQTSITACDQFLVLLSPPGSFNKLFLPLRWFYQAIFQNFLLSDFQVCLKIPKFEVQICVPFNSILSFNACVSDFPAEIWKSLHLHTLLWKKKWSWLAFQFC